MPMLSSRGHWLGSGLFECTPPFLLNILIAARCHYEFTHERGALCKGFMPLRGWGPSWPNPAMWLAIFHKTTPPRGMKRTCRSAEGTCLLLLFSICSIPL
jgi:hypothetical protein